MAKQHSSRKSLYWMAASLRQLWRFRLRSALILLSGVLGVGGVISAVNYAAEGRKKVLDRIQGLGTNVLIVSAQQSRSVGGRAKTGSIVTTLNGADYAEILREVPEIERSSATVSSSFLVKSGDLSKNNCVVVGTEPAYARIRHWQMSEGEFFGTPETRRAARVAVLGATVQRDLFGSESPVGQRVLINRVPFEVLGVLEERGQGLDAANEDNQIYVPLSTAVRRLSNLDYFAAIVFEMAEWEQMDEAAGEIQQILRRRHHAPANQPEDFQIQNQKALVDTEIAASQRLAFLAQSAGLSALVVSGLGILAIGWIAVTERITEIGVRRALGATRTDVFFQFLFEATATSLLACAAGLGAGWQITRSIAARTAMPFVFDWNSARIALACALGMNLFFALIPSRRAALVDPIHALKAE